MSENGCTKPQSAKSIDSTALRRSSRIGSAGSNGSEGRGSTSWHSVLTDNTDIDVPKRRSWWKKIDRNSINMKEVFGDKAESEAFVNIEDIIQTDVVPSDVQTKKLAIDLKNLSDSSSSESLGSIKIPQRKLFTQRQTQQPTELENMNKPTQASPMNMERESDSSGASLGSIQINQRKLFTQKKTKQADDFVKIMKKREPLKKIVNDSEKTIQMSKKTLFSKNKNLDIGKAAYHVSINATTNITKVDRTIAIEAAAVNKKLFGNKNRNLVAFPVSLMSESDDDTLEVQDRLGAFKKPHMMARSCRTSASSRSSKRAHSPASFCSETVELEDWTGLPCSTMIGDNILTSTPAKKLCRERIDTGGDNENVEVHNQNEIITNNEDNEHNFVEKQTMSETNNVLIKEVSKSKSKDMSEVTEKSKLHDRVEKTLEDTKKSIEQDKSKTDLNQPKFYRNDDIPENNTDKENKCANEINTENIHIQSKDNNMEEDDSILNTDNEDNDDQEISEIQDEIHIPEKDNQADTNEGIQESEFKNKTAEENLNNDNENSKASNGDASANETLELENEHNSSNMSIHSEEQNQSQSILNESQEKQNKTQVANDSQVEQYESQEENNTTEEHNEIEEEANLSQHEENISENIVEQLTKSSNEDKSDKDVTEEEDNEDVDVSEDNEDIESSVHSLEKEEEDVNCEESKSDGDDFQVVSLKSRQNDSARSNRSNGASQIREDEESNRGNNSEQIFSKNINSITIDPGRMSTAQHSNRYSVDFSKNLSDGARSSIENSGWNSHTTAYIQRAEQTMNARKSLRALVLSKSAKISSAKHVEDSVDYVEHDITRPSTPIQVQQESTADYSAESRSLNMAQTKITNYLKNIAQDNMQHRQKIQEKVKRCLKKPVTDPNCERAFFQWSKEKYQPEVKELKSAKRNKDLNRIAFADRVHKPPKLFKPPKATWINIHLYNFLYTKLAPRYRNARFHCEKVVQILYEINKHCSKRTTDTRPLAQTLKGKMASMGLVATHFEFYKFIEKFMPAEFGLKMIPDLFNGLPMPEDIFSDIITPINFHHS